MCTMMISFPGYNADELLNDEIKPTKMSKNCLESLETINNEQEL